MDKESSRAFVELSEEPSTTQESHSKLQKIHNILKTLEDLSGKNLFLSFKIKATLFGKELKEGEKDTPKEVDLTSNLDGIIKRLNVIHDNLVSNSITLERILKEL